MIDLRTGGLCRISSSSSGYCPVVTEVTVIVSLIVGKESWAERSLSMTQAPIRPCPRCGHGALGSLGKPPSRLPTHKLPAAQEVESGERLLGRRAPGDGLSCRPSGQRPREGSGEGASFTRWTSVSSTTSPPWIPHLGKEKARMVPGTPNYGRKASKSQRT